MKASGNPDYAAPARSLGFIFLTTSEKTSVFYISGAGLVNNAPHRDLAMLFLEFITGAEQQPTLTSATIDYPINPMSLPHDFIDDIGGFYEYPIRLNDAAAQYQTADQLIKAAGWQ
jgi:iron(III) transport system substrate-binding protein